MTTFTSPPTAPSTSDPTNFATLADAFIAWFATHVSELNAAGVANVGNATTLLGGTWAAPGAAIGSGTPVAITTTALVCNTSAAIGGALTSADRLTVTQSTSNEWAARIKTSGQSTGQGLCLLIIGGTNGSDYVLKANSQSGTPLFSIAGDGTTLPGTDNAQTLGSGSFRWSVVYAGTGTINTSDATEKTSVTPLSDAELAASKEIAGEFGTFKFLSAIVAKGDAARMHVGTTVQRVIEIMQSHGLDPFAYGFICLDEWADEFRDEIVADGELSREIARQVTSPVTRKSVQIIDGIPTLLSATVDEPRFDLVAVVDEAGAPVTVNGQAVMHPVPVMETVEERYNRVLARAAGSRYGFRTDELLLFIARGIDARLAADGL